jgi:hypothetical protein
MEATADALRQSRDALLAIREQMQPFLGRPQDPLAQTAVALSLGTLRYMGARLRGLDQGRLPNDPLRQELNNIRQLLVRVKKKKEAEQSQSASRQQQQQQQAAKPQTGVAGAKESSVKSELTGEGKVDDIVDNNNKTEDDGNVNDESKVKSEPDQVSASIPSSASAPSSKSPNNKREAQSAAKANKRKKQRRR